MGQFTVLNTEQQELCRECGMDPKGFVVIIDNDRTLALLHLKTRNEVSIHKNRRVSNGRT